MERMSNRRWVYHALLVHGLCSDILTTDPKRPKYLMNDPSSMNICMKRIPAAHSFFVCLFVSRVRLRGKWMDGRG